MTLRKSLIILSVMAFVLGVVIMGYNFGLKYQLPSDGSRLGTEITFNNQFDYYYPIVTNWDDPSIPDEVKNATAKKLEIEVTYYLNPYTSINNSAYPLPLFGGEVGTGFCVYKNNREGEKIVLTARHVIFNEEMAKNMGSIEPQVHEDGHVIYGDFQYRVYAKYQYKKYELIQLGVGNMSTENDYIGFKIKNNPEDLPTMNLKEGLKNGEYVYSVGFSRVPSPNAKNRILDIVEGPYLGKVDGFTERNIFGQSRLIQMYRINGKAGPGFSGGPVLDENGNVVGMTVIIHPVFDFFYAIPTSNLLSFLSALN